MMKILLILSLFITDPVYIRIDANVRVIQNYKTVSCGQGRFSVGLGNRQITAFGLDLRGLIKQDGKSYPMTDDKTGKVYQVKCKVEKNGLLLFIVSDSKSYIISKSPCQ